VQIVLPFTVDVAGALAAMAGGFSTLLLCAKVSEGGGGRWNTKGCRTFFTPARLARLALAGLGEAEGVLERRSLPKILAARASFFLRSRAAAMLVSGLGLGVSGCATCGIHTLVDHLLEIGGDFAAILAVGGHGWELAPGGFAGLEADRAGRINSGWRLLKALIATRARRRKLVEVVGVVGSLELEINSSTARNKVGVARRRVFRFDLPPSPGQGPLAAAALPPNTDRERPWQVSPGRALS
jgi:hypothetical protein